MDSKRFIRMYCAIFVTMTTLFVICALLQSSCKGDTGLYSDTAFKSPYSFMLEDHFVSVDDTPVIVVAKTLNNVIIMDDDIIYCDEDDSYDLGFFDDSENSPTAAFVVQVLSDNEIV